MESPSFATTVSFIIAILPSSIRVGRPTELNSVINGPGGKPVFPAVTVISSGAICPGLARVFILFLSRIRESLKGSIFAKMKIFEPMRYCSSLVTSGFSSLHFLNARRKRVFFVTFRVASPSKSLRNFWICLAPMPSALAIPSTSEDFIRFVSSSTISILAVGIFFAIVVVDICLYS